MSLDDPFAGFTDPFASVKSTTSASNNNLDSLDFGSDDPFGAPLAKSPLQAQSVSLDSGRASAPPSAVLLSGNNDVFGDLTKRDELTDPFSSSSMTTTGSGTPGTFKQNLNVLSLTDRPSSTGILLESGSKHVDFENLQLKMASSDSHMDFNSDPFASFGTEATSDCFSNDDPFKDLFKKETDTTKSTAATTAFVIPSLSSTQASATSIPSSKSNNADPFSGMAGFDDVFGISSSSVPTTATSTIANDFDLDFGCTGNSEVVTNSSKTVHHTPMDAFTAKQSVTSPTESLSGLPDILAMESDALRSSVSSPPPSITLTNNDNSSKSTTDSVFDFNFNIHPTVSTPSMAVSTPTPTNDIFGGSFNDVSDSIFNKSSTSPFPIVDGFGFPSAFPEVQAANCQIAVSSGDGTSSSNKSVLDSTKIRLPPRPPPPARNLRKTGMTLNSSSSVDGLVWDYFISIIIFMICLCFCFVFLHPSFHPSLFSVFSLP